MAKQLNVSLNFTADTHQAKAQMQELQRQLNALSTTTNIPAGKRIRDDILGATKAAAELKTTLSSAMNADTGKLDLTKFSASLKSTGKDLQYYRQNLQKLGPEGSQAFLNLATAIQNAEAPLLKTNSLLGQMWTTMKNTARWQISSSVLHGIQGAFSSALGYAKDLNESLTNIRIVTGQSVEQMAEFAKEANKAAKNLGTTTTRYTDAALIYYQQGLSDKEVQERTNTTIKMANVTGENATEVSSYMTAIWNNFNKEGDQAVEHYADIMTKLGAETAASTDEIAAGLSKFSAVADTIGLSFEMASSAVTAIIDQTRESPEVVGTALKTIFSRMEGLKQGETLEDGVDLNKYSEGLAKVGVSIMDASGQLKDMDEILYDVGDTWRVLSKEQQVALAQTVAGTRQYNQFIALFDNWDKVEENLLMAGTAGGTLQEQADIYAESWEAASNRARASLEELYGSIIDDKFFIGMTNFAVDAVNTIDSVIEGLGGVKGLLLLISSIVTTKLGPQMAKGLTSAAISIGDTFTNGAYSSKVRGQAAKEVDKLSQTTGLSQNEVQYYKNIGDLTKTYEQNVVRMSDLEKEVNLSLIERQKVLQNNSIELEKQVSLTKQESDEAQRKTNRAFTNSTNANSRYNFIQTSGLGANSSAFTQEFNAYRNTIALLNTDKPVQEIKELEAVCKSLGLEFSNNTSKTTILNEAFERMYFSLDDIETQFNLTESQMKTFRSLIEEELQATSKSTKAFIEHAESVKKADKAKKDAESTIKNSTGAHQYWATSIVSATQALSSLTMAVTSFSTIKGVWNNDDLTNWEKFTSIATSLTMVLPMLINGISGLTSTIQSLNAVQTSSILFGSVGKGIKNYSNILSQVDGISKSASNFKQYHISTLLVKNGLDDVAASQIANKVATEGLTEANKKLIVANLGLQLSLGKVLIAFAAIAAIIGAVVFVYKKLQERNNQFRNEAKETEKVLKSTSEGFEEISSSIQGVKNSLDALEGKYKTLDKLTQGSAEWREQLYEINSEVQDIIDKYNLQEGIDWNRTADGAQFITDEGNKKIEAKNNIDQINAQSAVDSANYVNAIATNKATKEEILHNQEYSTKYQTGTRTIHRSGGTQELAMYETIGLSQSGLDSIISLLDQNPSFNLSSEDDLLNAGFNETDAEIISSNTELQKAIQELTVSTYAVKESYENSLENSLLLDPEISKKIYGEDSTIGEGYRTDLLNQMAQDIETAVTTAVQTRELTQDPESETPITVESAVSDYLDYANIISEDGKYFQKDSEGEKGAEISAEKVEEAAIAYKEQQTQIKKARNEFKKYETAVEKSTQVWKKVKKVQDIEGQQGAWSKLKKAVEENAETNLDNIKSYSEYDQVKSVLVDILELEEDQADALDPTFIQNNLGLIDEAINGNADSLNNLKGKFEEISGQEVLVKMGLIENTEEQLGGELGDVLSQIQSEIDKEDLTVGAQLDLTEFIPKLEKMVSEGKISCEKLEEYLSLNGFEGVSIEPEYEDVRIGRWQNFINGNGFKVTYEKQFVGFKNISGTNDSGTTTSADGTKSVILTRDSYSGKTEDDLAIEDKVIEEKEVVDSGDLATTDDDSGSKKTVSKLNAEKETVERFKEINDLLDDQADKLERISDQADLTFGKNRVQALKNINAELEKENELLDDKIADAETYMTEDKNTIKTNLKNLAKEWGLSYKDIKFKYDDEGNITNYTEVIEELQEKLYNKKEAYDNKYGDQTETAASRAALESIEAAEEYLNNVIEAASNYDDAREEKEDAIKDQLNNDIEKLSNNYEALEIEIEARVTINENDKKALDHEFDKLSDNVYKASEALAVLWDPEKNDKIDNAIKALEGNNRAVEDLKIAYQNGDISAADYYDGLQNQHDEIWDNIDALEELDETMKDYYGNTLDMVLEEISKYTDQMDNLTTALEHYKTILELTGRENNYGDIDTVLKGQAKTLKNNYDISTKNYEMLLKQKKEVEDRLATMDKTDAGYEYEKAKLDQLIEETDAAYDEMLTDAEDYLTTLQEIWKNAMEQIKETTANALTGNMGFDSLMDSLGNLKTHQDEYLTETNKLFETNKMLSDIQGDIDKTNNTAAKQRLNNFAQEIEQLQKKGKLSNLELEIAQAKYKQLQAQIALEEAQNAKSVVRLSRDNEGNYGYVYTADQGAIDEAEDQLAQAENDLYNIRLNATNEYGEKMLQAEQDYMDKVAEVWEKYKDDEVKRNAELARLEEEYYALIGTYSDLYVIAQQEDTRVVEDAWINQYDNILGKSLDWKTKLEEYIAAIEAKHQEWYDASAPILDDLDLKSDTLAASVQEITTKSDELVVELTKDGGVLETLEEELDWVNQVTGAYNLQRDAILGVIDAAKQMAETIGDEIAGQSGEVETEWNKRLWAGDNYENAKYQGVDKYGNVHYSNISQDSLDDLIEQSNSLSEKANEVNQKRAKIVNDRKAAGEKVYSDVDKFGILHYAKTPEKLKSLIKKANAQSAPSFDTGGYTGKWGPEGKLAMLHEKEIILNKEDTSNILKVVEIVRAMIDTNATNAGLGILHSPGINSNNQNLEQTVTITAEFPNATDHNEIEMAFNSLINRASQYANRK